MKYFKWQNDVIGEICKDEVNFLYPLHNTVVAMYTQGESSWSRGQFEEFLRHRIISPQRRDIEQLLHRCGLPRYDVLQIAYITHAINSMDQLWIADNAGDKLNDVATDVFKSIFYLHTDVQGGFISDSPEGCNVKRYGVYNGHYGIYKNRLYPMSTDAESECAVYLLSKELGVPCCPAVKTNHDTVFSKFVFAIPDEQIVHFRNIVKADYTGSLYSSLVKSRRQYNIDLIRMLILDFVTRQDDRHLSNFAVKISGASESFYPLYDNGRSLFYEDSEETVVKTGQSVLDFATSFGNVGTYYDCLCEAAAKYPIQFAEAAAPVFNITDNAICRCLHDAGIPDSGTLGYRFNGCRIWVNQTLEIIKELTRKHSSEAEGKGHADSEINGLER